MQQYILIGSISYLLIINLLGYITMWADKRKAIKGKYRIAEKTLFMIAILGGSIGSILGMNKFRHKTKHWYFKYGMPAILIVQLILIVVVGIEILNLTK